MKIKLPQLVFTGISLAVTLTGEAALTNLKPDGTWSISGDTGTNSVRTLNIYGKINSQGWIESTGFIKSAAECEFNGIMIGRGNGNLSNNTAIGLAVLDGASATGNEVTGVGSYALQYNSSGNANTAIGHAAMQFNTTGIANTATGVYALRSNTVGTNNTASGVYSLLYNSSGVCNTAIGGWSLSNNNTGNYNTAIGFQSLKNNQGEVS